MIRYLSDHWLITAGIAVWLGVIPGVISLAAWRRIRESKRIMTARREARRREAMLEWSTEGCECTLEEHLAREAKRDA